MTSYVVWFTIVQVNTNVNTVFIIILGKRETYEQGEELLTDTLMKAISKTAMVQ